MNFDRLKKTQLIGTRSFLAGNKVLSCFPYTLCLPLAGNEFIQTMTKIRPAVNFINVIRTNFLYESSFKAKTQLEKRTQTLIKLTAGRISALVGISSFPARGRHEVYGKQLRTLFPARNDFVPISFQSRSTLVDLLYQAFNYKVLKS